MRNFSGFHSDYCFWFTSTDGNTQNACAPMADKYVPFRIPTRTVYGGGHIANGYWCAACNCDSFELPVGRRVKTQPSSIRGEKRHVCGLGRPLNGACVHFCHRPYVELLIGCVHDIG